jgi:hypothetical protein
MEFFRIKNDIPFMRHVLVLNVISFITFGLAVFFIVTKGLNPSIEFTGGTLVEVEYASTADINRTRGTVEQLGFGEVQVQKFGTSRDVLIRLPVRGDMKQDQVSTLVFDTLCKAEQATVGTKQYTTPQGEQVSRPACTKADGSEPLKLTRTEFVGPSVGEELYTNGALALGVTILGIIARGAGGHPGGAGLLGERVGRHLRPHPRELPPLPQARHAADHRPRHHQHHQPHRHHPRQHADHGAEHADLRRADAAPLLGGADHRHPVRHLLVHLRGRRHRHVAGRQARRPGEAREQGPRPERPQCRGRGVE